jgi:DNA-binding XRE family transcriptional regulator
METEKISWARKVSNLRKQLNLGQDALAVIPETNQCTISCLERGVTTPAFRMCVKLDNLGNVFVTRLGKPG